jgi:hypothetical protein
MTGTTASSVLSSTTTLAAGQPVSTSASSGTGSRPAMRAARTSRQGSWATAPLRSVTRSRVGSCMAISTPSAVTLASVSNQR